MSQEQDPPLPQDNTPPASPPVYTSSFTLTTFPLNSMPTVYLHTDGSFLPNPLGLINEILRSVQDYPVPPPALVETNEKCQLCGGGGQIVDSDNTYDCPHCINHKILRERKETPSKEELRFPCEICYEDESSVVFNECNHLVGCEPCIKVIHEREEGYKCPKCGVISNNISRVYI